MRTSFERAKWNLLDESVLRGFSESSLPRWLAAVAFEWALIAATMWICNTWPSWWSWVAGIFFIGTRQHALGVLAHEGSHHLVSRSRRWNDLLSNYLTAYPLTLAVEGYRATHLQHHWYLETPEDPSKVTLDHHPKDWTFPMSKWYFVGMLLRDLSGVSQKSSAELLKYLWHIPGGKRPHLIRIFVLHGAALALAVATGYVWTYLVLWLVPLFTVAVTCYRIRSIAEHSALGRQEDRYARTVIDFLRNTRTTTLWLIPEFLLAPYHVAYHIEHHLYPFVPGFRLRALHRLLRQHPDYVANAHVTRGHLQLFRELTGASDGGGATPHLQLTHPR